MNPHLVGLFLSKKTLSSAVIAILRKYGTDAHVYLPGIGTINGLTAGNYLDSAGTTAATVDNPVGLVLDGTGGFSAPLFSASNVTAGAYTGGAPVVGLATNYATVAGKSYQVTYTLTACVGSLSAQAGGTAGFSQSNFVGTYSEILVAVTTGSTNIGLVARGAGLTSCTGSVTVKEVTGIHAIQATSLNKPILKLTSGRYWWDFVDASDVLNMTYPAGYESVTTIDAAPAGQATLTAQNIVGTYTITTDTYGRFVFKTITASELAIVQQFANRLAGL